MEGTDARLVRHASAYQGQRSDGLALQLKRQFLQASSMGDEAMLADLLGRHNLQMIDINWADEHGMNGLHLSVKGGHLECVRRMVRSRIQVDSVDNFGATPLMFAALGGHEKIFDLLTRNGAQPYRTDKDGRTALFYGVEGCHRSIVMRLLQKCKSYCTEYVCHEDGHGRSALCYALNQYDMKMASILIAHGAPVDRVWPCDASFPKLVLKSALMFAAECNDLGFLSFCLHMGAQPDQKSYRVDSSDLKLSCRGFGLIIDQIPDCTVKASHGGKTPLMYAAENGSLTCADALLRLPQSQRVDLNAQDEYGLTPIMYAIIGGNADIIELLLSHGADPTIQDLQGKNALFFAAIRGTRRLRVYDLLFMHGCRGSDTDFGGRSPIAYAAACGHLDTVMTLIRRMGGDPYARCYNGYNMVFYAALSSERKMIRLFTDIAGMHLQSWDDMISPLIGASICRLPQSINTLLELKAGIHIGLPHAPPMEPNLKRSPLWAMLPFWQLLSLPASPEPLKPAPTLASPHEPSGRQNIPYLPAHHGIKDEEPEDAELSPASLSCDVGAVADLPEPDSARQGPRDRSLDESRDDSFMIEHSGDFHSMDAHVEDGTTEETRVPCSPQEPVRATEDLDTKLHSIRPASVMAETPWPHVYIMGLGHVDAVHGSLMASPLVPRLPPAPPVEVFLPPAPPLDLEPDTLCETHIEPSKESGPAATALERATSMRIGAYRPDQVPHERRE